jgi:hypothetical protein
MPPPPSCALGAGCGRWAACGMMCEESESGLLTMKGARWVRRGCLVAREETVSSPSAPAPGHSV